MPETPPAPKTEIHLKPVWNGLDQPVWIISTHRHSPVSRLIEKSPSYTRLWKSDWGWEIDHSEFKELVDRLRTAHTLCPQCLSGIGEECDGAIWKLWKIGCRPRKPEERRAPKDDQRYQYQPPRHEQRYHWDPPRSADSAEDDYYGEPESEPRSSTGMTPADAAVVLGMIWPIGREGASAIIKAAFSKAALATHTSIGELSGEKDAGRSDEAMKKVIEARLVLNEWAGVE